MSSKRNKRSIENSYDQVPKKSRIAVKEAKVKSTEVIFKAIVDKPGIGKGNKTRPKRCVGQ
jgi:hypothetical protein